MNANDLINSLYHVAAELLVTGDGKFAECGAICMAAIDCIDQLVKHQSS